MQISDRVWEQININFDQQIAINDTILETLRVSAAAVNNLKTRVKTLENTLLFLSSTNLHKC